MPTLFMILVCFFLSCDEKKILPEDESPNNETTDNEDKEEEDKEGHKVYNANIIVKEYNGPFLYGSNMGYKNGNWKDEDVADILAGNPAKGIAGIGVNSLRPALYEFFVEEYGYSVRLEAFNHYQNIGTIHQAVFIGDHPSDIHREKKEYVSGHRSQSFENLYEPIWDNGENGTPVNDENYYALYVYKLVKNYGKNISFWEIKNEPDFTYTGHGDKHPGEKGNWWDQDPKPEELENWKAPIQSYIRLLRVSYEVIKYLNPEAYVCVGGIGYTSFLDAIMRNTDNPDEGKVTDEYPLKGGAWFDCLSYHVYPMYYLRSWAGDAPGNINGFHYYRTSDHAARNALEKKNIMFDLMRTYGYDGVTYPQKETIVTEVNIANKSLGDHIGSQEAQRNFLIKFAILSQVNKISGVYIFCPWDDNEAWDDSGHSFNYMGFYKPLPETPGLELRLNESGTAWKTMTNLLKEYRYSRIETEKLHLPPTIEGAAFLSEKNDDAIYVLWAKTETDLSEEASQEYTFPENRDIKKLYYKQWDGKTIEFNNNKITLTGSPLFIKTNNPF